MSQPKIILVAGPTASGKSALALDLARRAGGVIINADAMQIYAGLPILANQPDAGAQKEIPHRLYAILDPAEPSSAGKWLTLAREAIAQAVKAGRTPVLAGGTGLYFKALLGGLSDIPAVPDNVRAEAAALYDRIGEEQFRRELAKLDSDSAARLAKNDRQRSIRAYEVVAHTGKPIGEWHEKHSAFGIRHSGGKPFQLILPECRPLNAESHLLMPPREELYAACDRRFALMVRRGAVEEARQFLKRNLDPGLPAMKTLGLRELGAHLKGEITLEQAVAKAQQATRNYAKRQMTWFRNQWTKKSGEPA